MSENPTCNQCKDIINGINTWNEFGTHSPQRRTLCNRWPNIVSLLAPPCTSLCNVCSTFLFLSFINNFLCILLKLESHHHSHYAIISFFSKCFSNVNAWTSLENPGLLVHCLVKQTDQSFHDYRHVLISLIIYFSYQNKQTNL